MKPARWKPERIAWAVAVRVERDEERKAEKSMSCVFGSVSLE